MTVFAAESIQMDQSQTTSVFFVGMQVDELEIETKIPLHDYMKQGFDTLNKISFSGHVLHV